jgi:hypothetical protein
MTKPKTQAQLDRATDLRLKKTYGVGLDWYNEQFVEQAGGCAVCGEGPGTRRLNIDHDHKWKKIKIKTNKCGKIWNAYAEYNGAEYEALEYRTKSEALTKVKEELKRASVRGLLCHRCNRAMILFRDDSAILELAADYLREHRSPDNGQEYCDMCDGTGLMEGWMHRDGYSCPKCKGKALLQKGTQ